MKRKNHKRKLEKLKRELEKEIAIRKKELEKRVRSLERIEAELEEIKESERELRKIFENAPFGIYTVNEKGILDYINPAMVKISGTPRKKLLDINVLKLPTYKKINLSKKIRECLKGRVEKFSVGPTKYTSYYGKKTTVRKFTGVALRDSSGKIKKVVIFVEDLTRIKKSEERFKLLFENAVDPIVVLDKEGKFIEVNKKVKEILGYEKKELIGKYFFRLPLLTEESKEIALRNFKKRMRGINVNPYVIEVVKKNGEKMYGEINASLLKEDGKIIGEMVIIRDVTERIRIEEEKNRFLTVAAHELKTPITAIHGFAQLLQDDKIGSNPELRKKYLKIIEKEMTRLAKLANDILDLTKAEMGTLSFFFSEVDLNKLLEEIRENMKERIKEKNLKFFVEGIGKLPKIFTDGERVKQVLINLIDNAIKYTPKGEIRVKAVKRNGFIRFEVKDTGIGIPKTFHEKIFTPFFQIDSPLTRKAKGSGLGLSICKIIVEKLGGKIWFKSEEGKGTTFYFTLPLKRM